MLALSGLCPGQIQGDAELLRLVAKANKSNLERIVTWQGQAKIADKLVSPNGVQSVIHSAADFVHDASRESTRWHWETKQAYEERNGTRVPLPEQFETIDEMIKPEGYYNYSPGFIPFGSDKLERTLAISPRETFMEHANATSRSFSPLWYFKIEGLPVHRQLMWYYDRRDLKKFSHKVVSRSGDIVTYESRFTYGDAPAINRYRFDLSKGGNLVEVYLEDAYTSTLRKWVYAEQKGIWVPKSYTVMTENKQPGVAPAKTSAREVVFAQNVVNEQVDPTEFSLAKFNLKFGARVSDARIGVSWIYGRETERIGIIEMSDQSPEEVPALELTPEEAASGDAAASVSEDLDQQRKSPAGVALAKEDGKQRMSRWAWLLGGLALAAGVILILSRLLRRQRRAGG